MINKICSFVNKVFLFDGYLYFFLILARNNESILNTRILASMNSLLQEQ